MFLTINSWKGYKYGIVLFPVMHGLNDKWDFVKIQLCFNKQNGLTIRFIRIVRFETKEWRHISTCTRCCSKKFKHILIASLEQPKIQDKHSRGWLNHVVLLFFGWVLTSYVFLVTSFAAIGVGKRGIRSSHVKFSGRSSLADNLKVNARHRNKGDVAECSQNLLVFIYSASDTKRFAFWF